jgi:hypothetical protein
VTFPSSGESITYASSPNGLISMQLPPGLKKDLYAVSLSVQIYDNIDGFVVFHIAQSVTSFPNLDLAFAIADGVRSNDPNCKPCMQLKANTLAGTMQVAIAVIQALDGSITTTSLNLSLTNVNRKKILYWFYLS